MSAQVLFRPCRSCREEKNGFSNPGRFGLVPQGGIVRPFGACFGISSARTPCVQREMWGTLSLGARVVNSNYPPRRLGGDRGGGVGARITCYFRPAKRDTMSSPATRDETYGKRSQTNIPAPEGPTFKRSTPLGLPDSVCSRLSAGQNLRLFMAAGPCEAI